MLLRRLAGAPSTLMHSIQYMGAFNGMSPQLWKLKMDENFSKNSKG